MITIEKPENEDARLEALRAYQVLDSAQEQDYDDIVNMASEICDASVAYVSFIDEDRQWFKSTKNFDVKELPRNESICAYAITTPEKMLVIDNLQNDERFDDHPAVTGDMNVKFYASVALVNDDGYELGTICVFDKREKELRKKQLEALKALARQVINVLELKKLQLVHERNIQILDQRNKTFEKYVVNQTNSVSSTLSSINMMTDLLKKHMNDDNTKKAKDQIPKIQNSSAEVIKIIDQVREDYKLIDMCAKKKERVDLKSTFDDIFSSNTIKRKKASYVYISDKKAIYENKFLIRSLLEKYIEVIVLVNASNEIKFHFNIKSSLGKNEILIIDDAITPIDTSEFLENIHLILNASGTEMKVKFLKGTGHTTKISFQP